MTDPNSTGSKAFLENRRLMILVGLAVTLTCVSVFLTWPQSFGFIRIVRLTEIKKISGYMYEANLPRNFLPRKTTILPPGRVVVTENGKRFSRPVTRESNIEQHGFGEYRFKGDRVLFSSLDGSPPDENGRRYVISAPSIRTKEWVILLGWAAAVAVWILTVRGIVRNPSVRQALLAAAEVSRPIRRRIQVIRAANLAFYIGQKAKPSRLEQFSGLLLPSPFFLGVAAGLGSCILLGHMAATTDVYADRSRFFFLISPEGYIFPTPENLCRFVEGKAPKDKILVLVGGSSIPLGVGQTNASLWTKQLQSDLGDRFAVVNLSFRGASFTSIGLPSAEMLSKEYSRMYLVSDSILLRPIKWVNFQKDAPSYPYDYFLWQCWVNGKLLPDAKRDLTMRATAGAVVPDAGRDALISRSSGLEPRDVRQHAWENILHASLERITYSSNFWNEIGYRYFFTVYSHVLPAGDPFWLPRKEMDDDELSDSERPPIPQRFEQRLPIDLSNLHHLYLKHAQIGVDGELHFDSTASAAIDFLKYEMPKTFPPNHILFFVPSKSTYAVAHLNSNEQQRYREEIVKWAQLLRDSGYNAIPLGLDYKIEDYIDGSHFSEAAAPKMAKDVAAALKDMAKKDGWLNEEK